jgi:hypothetical protein
VRKLDFSQILDYQVPSTLGFLSNSWEGRGQELGYLYSTFFIFKSVLFYFVSINSLM